MIEPKARVIAFYLPQFHPVPENDEWWGKGFTEWTSVAKARPLFPGHEQPKLPGELGFYDLRIPEVRQRQAELAREHGIEGFCYWHYWFGNGRRMLERPFMEVLESGQPDYPFCLGWANHDWIGNAFGAGDRLLIKQTYPGLEDHQRHFDLLLRVFQDSRYIKVRGKPLFLVYKPYDLPNSKIVFDSWRKMAKEKGLPGLFIISDNTDISQDERLGFDGSLVTWHRRISNVCPRLDGFMMKSLRRLNHYFNRPIRSIGPKPLQRYSYGEAVKYMLKRQYAENEYPNIVPNWDTTPRLAHNAVIFEDATPQKFRSHVRDAINRVSHRDYEDRIIFLRSWNEWAEGNYIEPDEQYGRQRLEVLRDELFTTSP
ncbi:MAG: glycoside hydrolase family 99-like domain-containing protein [Thermodesulfobacteriota bacterium]|nr:glycoside hydrolase family 99-like domain-containing protein [Thermodesulfobacteriota bacterium]